ncbi:MAG: SMC family ATPase [Akkermansiaceae bacterium]|nr:SMC family ATPase [Akkermansiaceae bacterium]
MRIISLTVRNYRVHKDLTVNFDPSRNLVGGPNESGKSTLAEAAHRALFLRAKTGGNVQKEMVSTRHLGEPEVVLTFEAGGTRWELEKRFAATKGSTRLTAQGGATLRDDEAETKLAELLKTETAGGRGAAGLLPELWAHLWVWQGKAGDDPSAHTAAHKAQLIQHLQQSGVAAILQSAADQRVAGRIADSYAELFTNTGRPKAGSKPEVARIRLEESEAALERAREAATHLAQAADDHARAERDIAEVAAILPKLRQDRNATETKLQQVADLRRDEETHRKASEAAISRREELETQDLAIRELQSKLVTQTAALHPAEGTLASLATTEETARSANQTGETAQRQAAEALRRSRLLNDLATAAVAAFEKDEAHQRLAERAKEAAGIQDQLATLRSDLAKLPALEPKDVASLRKLETEVGQATAALEAMATGVELIESPVPVLLDGETLAPGGARVITDAGELVVGDGTRLRIRPGGGNSLATARARAENARETFASALQTLALRDMDHGTAVLEQRQTIGQKIDGLKTRWNALGGESLATELTRATAERDTAREELKRRSELAAESGSFAPPVDLADVRALVASTRDDLDIAEAAETTARQQAGRLREKLEAATAALARQRDETATARQTLRDLETGIKTREETHGDEANRTQGIAAAREAERQAAAKLAATSETLAALNPDLLSADLERFNRALAAQEARLRDAENTRLLARDRLTLDGSTDPEAELRHTEARRAAALENHASEQRRAKAIETLHQLFTSSREAIDRALVQPLADRISGYLQCIFGPGTEARVQLSETGIEGLELVRAGDSAFSFATLSGGAKEQTAAAVRLALAEILAADHDGCLPVIFDDAFAYSDPERIQSLQRMLDLAAVRGLQVIVLTCTPGDYSALGANEIRLIK